MLLDYISLWQFAGANKSRYADAHPFPHIVMDNFLPERALQMALEGFPEQDSILWKRNSNEYTENKADIKYGFGNSKDLMFGKARPVFLEFSSGSFAGFLDELCGVKFLVPDPYYVEGGYHMVGDGGKLDPHADFSHHPMGLERRVNMLLYLNPDWHYGGNLTLYDPEMRPIRTIEPILNRCVIFTTSATSFHGHPEPMSLPPGILRRSIALYYYSKPRVEREKHKAIFPKLVDAAQKTA